MKKVLMHTCCAPCSVYCIDSLREEDIEPTVFWYNPNIHPYIEYKTRRDCLKDYAAKIGIETIFKEDYGLDEFCKNVVSDIPNRCVNYCYKKTPDRNRPLRREKRLRRLHDDAPRFPIPKARRTKESLRRTRETFRRRISLPRLPRRFPRRTNESPRTRNVYAKILRLYFFRRRSL